MRVSSRQPRSTVMLRGVVETEAELGVTVHTRFFEVVVSRVTNPVSQEVKLFEPRPIQPPITAPPLTPVEKPPILKSHHQGNVVAAPDEKFHVKVARTVPVRPPHLSVNVTEGVVMFAMKTDPPAKVEITVPTASAFAGIVVELMSTVSDVVLVTVTTFPSAFSWATYWLSSVVQSPSSFVNQPTSPSLIVFSGIPMIQLLRRSTEVGRHVVLCDRYGRNGRLASPAEDLVDRRVDRGKAGRQERLNETAWHEPALGIDGPTRAGRRAEEADVRRPNEDLGAGRSI